jgi:Zn-dependent peptidase ImmA (M78 family)/transcriptional regulator with XRE-family HTH domain
MDDPINPAMLILAREMRGLTQAEVAKRAGIAQATVSKYENETIETSAEHLAKLAEVLNFPVSFFRQRERTIGTMCVRHRKRQSLSVKDHKQIHAKFNVVVLQIRKLLQSVDIDSAQRLHAMPLDEYGTPEKVAISLRSAWKMPAGPVRNIAAIIESSGVMIFTLPLETAKFDALSLLAPNIPPVMFVNANFPGDRLRFTLAHEIGHLVMHTDPSPTQEEESDRFASEFLMPANEIRPDLTRLTFDRLATLKAYWKVSMQALIRRAYTLGTISERQQRTFFMKLSSNGWRKNEPVEVPVETPSVLRSVVDVHLRDHGYTIAELSAAICASPDDFEQDYLDRTRPKLRLYN